MVAPASPAFVLPSPISGTGGRASIYIWRTGSIDNITSGHKKTPSMTRREWLLMVAADPQGDFEVESASFTGRARAVIVRPNHAHAMRVDGSSVIRLTITLIHPRIGALMKRPGPEVEVLPRDSFAAVNDLLRSAADGLASLDAAALCKQLMDIVLQGCPEATPIDPRIVKALRKLSRELDYPFEALAAEADMSLSRMSHLVSEQLGVSLRQYQAWLRMAYAWQYIVWSPQMSFTEIAHTLKFSDSSHLARAFRSSYGVPPSLFRDVRSTEVVVSVLNDSETLLGRNS